ncbi:MAG: hypothetical protein PVI30_16935 [Myxococcales bacterium]|jgi:hypothetical protein
MEGLYMVLASLPHLEHFTRMKRLPINEERLLGRIQMAPDPARSTLLRVYDLLAWHRGSEHAHDRELLDRFRDMIGGSDNPTVRGVLRVRLRIRLVLTALRYQHQGRRAFPEHLDAFDLEPLLYTVRERWNQSCFGLQARFPAIVQADRLLREGRSEELERLLFDLTWDELSEREHRSRTRRPFDLDELIVYVFKWDLARRWLLYDGDVAVERFDRIIGELVSPDDWRAA